MSKNEIILFSESFGDINNPAIILNAGAGNQAITWHESFCNKLAAKGYFVVRYDYRDAGLSPKIDYDKEPYDVLDLAHDAVNLLKKYDIKKAHFVGFSMGGQINQFIAAYLPEYAKSIILLGTSTDFRPGFDAFDGIESKSHLNQPHKYYVEWATQQADKQSLDEKVDNYIETWRLLDGSQENFDKQFYRDEAMLFYTRTDKHNSYASHAKAMRASFDLHDKAPELIKIPTLIIQGEKDPVFPGHGEEMAKRIKNSKLIVWDDFAHAISPQNFDRIVEEIDKFIKEQK
ncbi:MAG: alpha/beta hydrolase [Rickettsiales bacterium]